MIISRKWAMPSPDTFTIDPIRVLLKRYIKPGEIVVDPFARNAKIGTITNDLNPGTSAQHHMDAVEFLGGLIAEGVRADVVLCDPPYSPRQISEAYKIANLGITMETTQNARFYRLLREQIDRLLLPQGLAIWFGWNTAGMGQHYEPVEYLIVCHGAAHNDTLVTVERKMQTGLFDAK